MVSMNCLEIFILFFSFIYFSLYSPIPHKKAKNMLFILPKCETTNSDYSLIQSYLILSTGKYLFSISDDNSYLFLSSFFQFLILPHPTQFLRKEFLLLPSVPNLYPAKPSLLNLHPLLFFGKNFQVFSLTC